MVYEFKLPDVGEGIHEGEIVKWHVKEGDNVDEDQLIVEVMTDKATVEITSPKKGAIASIKAQEGEQVKVGEVIVAIDEGGAGASKPEPKEEKKEAKQEKEEEPSGDGAGEKEEKTLFDLPKDLGGASPFRKGPRAKREERPVVAPQAAAQQTEQVEHPAGRPIAAPAVRRMAREKGVDLEHVRGSGPVGRITRSDLEQFIQSQGEGPRPGGPGRAVTAGAPHLQPVAVQERGPVERVPMRGLRKKIAENMQRSKTIASHYTYVEEVDATALLNLRDDARRLVEERGLDVKINPLPFIVKAVVAALKKYPLVNSSYDETTGELVYKKYYNIGIAAATDEGLIVPVVKDADKKSIFQLSKEIAELGEKARNKKASPDDLSGGCFTITSLGRLGGMLATPIINYPEVAIMGVHAIKDKPVVRDGQIVPGKLMNLSFTFDHRIVDGAVGAEFAATLIRFLEDPKLLILDTA